MSDKIILITGASSGIGEAAARLLAREPGARLILVARREARLRDLAAELGGSTTWVAADLVDDAAPGRIRAHVEEHHGRLDILVNNAGAAWRARFDEGGYANVRRTMDLNFDAQVRLTEELLPLLRRSAPSAIVNVGSTAGRVARPAAAPTARRSSRLRDGRTHSGPRSVSTACTSVSCSPDSSPRRASRRRSSSPIRGRDGSYPPRNPRPAPSATRAYADGPSATSPGPTRSCGPATRHAVVAATRHGGSGGGAMVTKTGADAADARDAAASR